VRRALAAGAVVALWSAPAAAAGGPFGLGLILGEPTGLSAKLFLDGRSALDFALDFSFLEDAFYFHMDYVLHFGGRGSVALPYIGVGGKVAVKDNDHHEDHDRFGVRVPLGVAFMPRSLPIDIFGEVVPGITLLPETDPDVDAGIGIRLFF
jgi:hypothetical protein